MKKKSLFALLGAAAAAAALIPYSRTRNEETGESTTKALLWRMTTRPDPEDAGRKVIEVHAFENPFGKKADCCCDDCCEADFADEELCPACAESPCACELTLSPDLSDLDDVISGTAPAPETEAPVAPDAPNAPEQA